MWLLISRNVLPNRMACGVVYDCILRNIFHKQHNGNESPEIVHTAYLCSRNQNGHALRSKWLPPRPEDSSPH